MPKLTGTANYVRYAHEIMFSIYFPLLLIWMNVFDKYYRDQTCTLNLTK